MDRAAADFTAMPSVNRSTHFASHGNTVSTAPELTGAHLLAFCFDCVRDER